MQPFYLHRPLLLHGPSLSCLCGLKKGGVVELTQDMGKGFETDQIEPLENYATVLIFTTGSGISPIKSLIESGFNVDKGFDVKLFYGARNPYRMAYQDVKKMKMNHGGNTQTIATVDPNSLEVCLKKLSGQKGEPLCLLRYPYFQMFANGLDN